MPASPQVLSEQELPSTAFHARLDAAMSYWRKEQGKRPAYPITPTVLLRIMTEAAPGLAPDRANTVHHWIKEDAPSIPGLDYCFILARALGVRSAWLAFADGEMTERAPEAQDEHERDAAEVARELRGGKRKRRAG